MEQDDSTLYTPFSDWLLDSIQGVVILLFIIYYVAFLIIGDIPFWGGDIYSTLFIGIFIFICLSLPLGVVVGLTFGCLSIIAEIADFYLFYKRTKQTINEKTKIKTKTKTNQINFKWQIRFLHLKHYFNNQPTYNKFSICALLTASLFCLLGYFYIEIEFALIYIFSVFISLFINSFVFLILYLRKI